MAALPVRLHMRGTILLGDLQSNRTPTGIYHPDTDVLQQAGFHACTGVLTNLRLKPEPVLCSPPSERVVCPVWCIGFARAAILVEGVVLVEPLTEAAHALVQGHLWLVPQVLHVQGPTSS